MPLNKIGSPFEGQELVFATGFEHPVDVIDDHVGGLLVADYGSGAICRTRTNPHRPRLQASHKRAQASQESLVPEILLLILVVLSAAIALLRRFVMKS